MIKPRSAVVRFAAEMERQLRENDHKGGWQGCNLWYLYERLLQEAGELGVVLAGAREGNVDEEAADVANFAMMIADIVAGHYLGQRQLNN